MPMKSPHLWTYLGPAGLWAIFFCHATTNIYLFRILKMPVESAFFSERLFPVFGNCLIEIGFLRFQNLAMF